MMYEVSIHKEASKDLKKAHKKIQQKVLKAILHLKKSGTKNFPMPIEPLLGKYKKAKYFEIKIDNDYRLFFRKENNIFYIRKAGTHNQLRTG